MSGLHPSAMRVASELGSCNDPVKAFVIKGGRLRFTGGANVAYLFGVSGSSTNSEDLAVKSWVRAVRRKAGAS